MKTPTPNPDPPRGTADAIERAALQVFYVKGYHGASIRAIAGAAGIGVATLFHHYPTKAAILDRVLHRAVDEMQADVDAVLYGLTDPRDRLIAGVRAMVLAHCERQSQSFVAQSELRSLEPQAAADIRTKRRQIQKLFDDAVREGLEAGHFSCTHPKEVARAIVFMTTQVASWYHAGGGMGPAEVADVHVDMALSLVGDATAVDMRRAPARAGTSA